MSWIETVPYERAEGRLRKLYDRVRAASGSIDNILLAHGLRPHTLEGHLTLYKYVLHHPGNRTPKWLIEAVGVYVSALNGCRYCVDHHAAGLRRLLGDDARGEAIREALVADAPERAFDGRELAVMRYARALTREPAGEAVREAFDALRAAGAEDGVMLELNQVVAYFAYANRTVLGLGVSTAGEREVGLSPSGEAADDWAHR